MSTRIEMVPSPVDAVTTPRNHGQTDSDPAMSTARIPYWMKEGENEARARRPRFRRPRRAKQGELTEREIEVLLFAARMGCVDVAAVQDAFFGSWPSPAQRALAKCFEGGYLNKLRGRSVNERDVYFVSPSAKRGYPLVEEALAAEGRKPAPIPAKIRLEEALMMARLAARFMRASRESALNFLEWRSERELRPVPALGQIVPDAYLRIARGGEEGARTASFLVEMERSDKAVAYWEQKFRRYVDLYETGRYEEAFGTRSLRVLVVVVAERQTAGRLRRLTGAAERAGATMVRLADWHELRSAPPEGVLRAPFWTQPGRPEPLPLFPGKSGVHQGTQRDQGVAGGG